MKEYTHRHGGHRQRLKDKVRENGLKVLQEHEILELLLTYTIPYKDTNALAHTLIDKFGNISNVLDANRNDLVKVSGVGEETALFLSTLPELINYYKQKRDNEVEILRSVSKCKKFFRLNYEIQKDEHFYVICLNSAYKVIAKHDVQGEDSCKVNFDVRNFASMISSKDIKAVVLFHTHPNGDVKPSFADIETTKSIFNICAIMKVRLCDHIVFNEVNSFSFEENNLIKPMYDEFIAKFPEQRTQIASISQLVGFEDE